LLQPIDIPGFFAHCNHWISLSLAWLPNRSPLVTDWVTAQTAAQAIGAYLVTITTTAEESVVAATFLTGADALSVFWIGCSDAQTEATFV
jgi:hypothetical protein